MSQPLNQSQDRTPYHLKASKTTPCKSAGITKTLLTPCRRQGLSRKFKGTPTHNRSLCTTPLISTPPSCSVPSTAVIAPVNPVVSNSPKQTETPLRKQSIGGRSRVSIQPESHVEDAKQRVTCTSKAVEKEDRELPDTKECKRDSKKPKPTKKVTQKKSKLQPNEVVPCANSKDDQNEANTPCAKVSSQQKSEHKNIEPELTNTDTSGASKQKFKRCLSLKKSSSSIDDRTDASEISNTPTRSNTSLLSVEFLKDCTVDVEKIVEHSDGEINVPRKRKCIVYSSDEDDFVSSQKSAKIQDNGNQEMQDEDYHVKVVEIKKRIKEKETRLAELKQAAVYKKLHNMEDLEKSIKMWKTCLEEALINLLPKLQEHGPMDMPTLMKNINVPKTIVYNMNTESFM